VKSGIYTIEFTSCAEMPSLCTCSCSSQWHAHMRIAHSRVGRTLVPPSAASGRGTGLESLLRARVSTPSAPPNSSVIALRLRQQRGRASSSNVLAASLQVWNGMMVLLGAARLGGDGMHPCTRPSEAPPPAENTAVATLEMTCCCYIIHPE
jgi:hypothetical protein